MSTGEPMDATPAEKFKADFAAFVEPRRTALGWSISQLAREAGLSNALVNPIVRGEGAPATHRSIKQLLDALGVDEEQETHWHARRELARSTGTPHVAEDTTRTSRPTGNTDPTPALGPGQDTAELEAAPARQTEPSPVGRSLGAIGVAAVLVLTNTITVLWLSSERDVDGRVRCLSAATVAGVWTKSGGRARPADVRPAQGSWYTYNGRALARGSYELHVGCGYLPNGRDWKVVAYSAPGITAANATVECDDSPETTSAPPYRGVCLTR